MNEGRFSDKVLGRAQVAGDAGFDLDIMLQDAALDDGNRPTPRMLANACIGMEAFDASYAARELHDALTAVPEGLAKAKGRLARILATCCDDFQRCLSCILAGRGVVQMLEDLDWLLALLKARTAIPRSEAGSRNGLRHALNMLTSGRMIF